MSGFAVRGRCPDAWRPMASGDGLLVRVRPPLGRLDRVQALGLCAAATTHGNGAVDVTRRAGLQIRGVTDASLAPLLAELVALGLVDRDPVRDARRAILVAPDWQGGDDTQRIAEALAARLDDLPNLPAKTGFAIDAGPAPILSETAADFRIERGKDGGLLLRADGREHGAAIAPGDEAEALVALARWFVETGGADAGRMARHTAHLPGWADGGQRPAAPRPRLLPGPYARGTAYGLPFGRIDAQDFAASAREAAALRVTPWRTILFEGAAPGERPGLLADPADPLLRTDACPGAPACPQASVATRTLAARLAPVVAGTLHVSGCAKGCARSSTADIVLTGRDGLFDLGFAARAGDVPAQAALAPARLLHRFGAA